MELRYFCADCGAPMDTHYETCRQLSWWSRTKRWATARRYSHFDLFCITFIIALIKAFTKWMF